MLNIKGLCIKWVQHIKRWGGLAMKKEARLHILHILYILFLVLFISNISYSQTQYPANYYDDAPDNFRRVGKLNILIRHAFPAPQSIYKSSSVREPNRAKVVDDKMLEFLKKERVAIIFDVADLWTEEEIKYAKEKYGIEVTKKINLKKRGTKTKEDVASAFTDENIDYFLQEIDEAEKSDTKISVHCRYGFHRAGALSAVYLIEKEGLSPEEAVNYWKRNAPSENIERFLMYSGEILNWDEDQINSVRRKYAKWLYSDYLYPKYKSIISFLREYKKRRKE